jgi:molybdate transport system ATP-binding protein
MALQARLDLPLLVITHDPADVEALDGHTIEVRDGRVV